MSWAREFTRRLEEKAALEETESFVYALKEAMKPFKAKDITIWTEYDINYDTYHIEVEIKNLPYFRWNQIVPRDAILSAPSSVQLMRAIGEMIADYFLSIPRVEPEGNIVLGDN